MLFCLCFVSLNIPDKGERQLLHLLHKREDWWSEALMWVQGLTTSAGRGGVLNSILLSPAASSCVGNSPQEFFPDFFFFFNLLQYLFKVRTNILVQFIVLSYYISVLLHNKEFPRLLTKWLHHVQRRKFKLLKMAHQLLLHLVIGNFCSFVSD